MSIAIDDLLTDKLDLAEVIDPCRPSPLPVTPGEILLEEFMRPLGLTTRGLAAALRVPPNRISDVVRGRRAITAGTALRLARYFSTSPQLWLNLQANFELRRAVDAEGAAVERDVRPRSQAA
jgi:addiction module HigA family antidote